MRLPASVRSRLIAGTALLFAARLVVSLFRTGPVLVADEIGYLTNARVLSGGLPGQMELAPFYRGGYSLLLAPLLGLGSSPTLTYHLALALNALLAASVFPLLYLMLRRFLAVEPGTALWAALAGAVYPALTVLSQVSMSENALFPLVCIWLICWGGLLAAVAERRAAVLWAAGLGASTGALWAVHGRMVTAVALTAALLLWLGLRRRLDPVAALAGLVALGALLAGSHALDAYIANHNYAGSAPDETTHRFHELFHGHGLRTALANLVGQAWYLVVATFGLLALVVADALERMRRGLRRGARPQVPPLGAILLGLTGLLLVVSAAAFPERTRPDMLIYGRYTEVVAPPFVAMGLAILAARRRPIPLSRALLGFGALTGVVVLIRATAADPEAANRWNVSALPFVTVQLGPAILIGAAVVAACGALLLLRASAAGTRALGGTALVLLLAVAAYGVWNPVRSSERAVYPEGWTSPQGPAEAAGARRIAYDVDNYDAISLYVPQWFLPHASFRLFHGEGVRPPSRFVLGGGSFPRTRSGPGARPLWRMAGRDAILWRLPAPRAR